MHILHKSIGLPQINIKKGDNANSAVLTISPLPLGYGITLGNSLRRVLLSSLPGTAITAIKISGITHEYSTIKGVKESVLDLILNLRSLRLKKHSDGEQVVEIPLVKSGKITAKDLKVASDIEILDPSQIIATCNGVDPKQKIKIFIEKGVGYRLVLNDDSAKQEDVEMILVDANFSPIKSVKYKVEPARVGELTNLDKLTLELETDGSISSENAIKLSSEILQSYFSLFNNENAYTDDEFITSFDKLKQEKEEKEKNENVSKEKTFTPIDILGLSQRTLNALVNGSVTSVEELLELPMTQLSQFRGFGQKAKTELEQVLRERGYAKDFYTNK